METIVIVGMSLAGLRAAETLRRGEFSGRIVAVSAEHHLPYDRPPLSKELLAGKAEPADVALREDGGDELELDWRLGTRATGLDVANRTVTLETGEVVAFDGAVLATGSTPRKLPFHPNLANVFTLRTLDDALAAAADAEGVPLVTAAR